MMRIVALEMFVFGLSIFDLSLALASCVEQDERGYAVV
jgi:hypothetical protein